ncbi:MAG: class I SAM-dependent methyltransferase [Steroidobacteraceae bacterium]
MRDRKNRAGPGGGPATDSIYPDTYFRELSPAWLNYVAALSSVPSPSLSGRFTYLELGCGRGHSAIVHAGAFPQGKFHACDLNPAHIEAAERRTAALGIHNIRFHEASFEDLLQEPLPSFDFIVLHGVYGWVPARDQEAIRSLIRRRLSAAGLVYVSYNCLPGWASEVPVRRLLVELAPTATGDSLEQTRQALHALGRLSDSRLRYLDSHPGAAAAVRSCAGSPVEYIAHEFMSEAWEAFYCIDVADQMAEAGLRYAGSATLTDNHAGLLIDDATAANIAGLPTERQRRLALDFACNPHFRRDVFFRPSATGAMCDRSLRTDDAIIGAIGDPERIDTAVKVPRGALHFQADFAEAVRSLMAGGSTTIADAAAALSGAGLHDARIIRNLLYLVAAGSLTPFAKVRRHGHSLGRHVRWADLQPANATVTRTLAFAVAQGSACVIPSEVLGGGVRIELAEAVALTESLGRASESAATGGSDGSLDALALRLLRLGILTGDER